MKRIYDFFMNLLVPGFVFGVLSLVLLVAYIASGVIAALVIAHAFALMSLADGIRYLRGRK